jgi:hypothetical protein
LTWVTPEYQNGLTYSGNVGTGVEYEVIQGVANSRSISGSGLACKRLLDADCSNSDERDELHVQSV